jgi:hypothetical protein
MSDNDSESSNSNKNDILDKIIEILKNIESEQKNINDELKKVKKEVNNQIKEQQINFTNLLKDFEEKSNEKINESIKVMKENIIKNISSKEKIYKVKISSKKNNLECQKSLLENEKIKFTIENIGETTIPKRFYLKSNNSNDDNIELNHIIYDDLKPNEKLKIETNFKILNLSDSSSTVYKTDIILCHDEIKKIIQEPFQFTINFLEEDFDDNCPFTVDDYNYFYQKITSIFDCDKKKIKNIILNIYQGNKKTIENQYKINKNKLFEKLIEQIFSNLTY